MQSKQEPDKNAGTCTYVINSMRAEAAAFKGHPWIEAVQVYISDNKSCLTRSSTYLAFDFDPRKFRKMSADDLRRGEGSDEDLENVFSRERFQNSWSLPANHDHALDNDTSHYQWLMNPENRQNDSEHAFGGYGYHDSGIGSATEPSINLDNAYQNSTVKSKKSFKQAAATVSQQDLAGFTSGIDGLEYVGSAEGLLEPSTATNSTEVHRLFQEYCEQKDVVMMATMLSQMFDEVAIGSLAWLQELVEIGYSSQEMAELLVEQARESPWISFEPWILQSDTPRLRAHTSNCAHNVDPEAVVAHPQNISEALNDLNAQNPVEKPSLRRAVASLCGLAGMIPTSGFHGSLKGFVDFSLPTSPVISYGSGSAALARARTAMTRLCTAMALVQRLERCCDQYTILCRTSFQDNKLEMNSVRFDTVLRFNTCMNSTSDRTIHRAAEEASEILRTLFGCVEDSDNNSHIDPGDSPYGECLQTITLATQVLITAFTAYVQAHCGSFSPFFLEHEVHTITLRGTERNGSHIVVSPKKLTCLSSMLQDSDVLAFELRKSGASGGCDFDVHDFDAYDIVASVDDLVDTWGPGAITSARRDRDIVYGLTLRGGVIAAEHGDTIHHWTKIEMMPKDYRAQEWAWREKIRIGANVAVNHDCRMKETALVSALEGHWLPLGTRRAYWKHQERQVGLQGGQNVTAVYNSTWDKVPGVSLKTQLISNLNNKIEYFAFLTACCGLQVSLCSGLARRVTMMELIADLLPKFVARQASLPHFWSMLNQKYSIIEKLISKNLDMIRSTFLRMSYEDSNCYLEFWSLASDLVKALELTGLQPTGDHFELGFIPQDTSSPLLRISTPAKGGNLWLKVLRDSESSATFAYATTSCFQIGEQHACQNRLPFLDGSIHLLQTDVQQQFLSTSKLWEDEWCLKHNETHFFRAKDDNRDILLSATVLRCEEFPEPRLFVKESRIPLHMITRMFRRQGPRYLQEKLTMATGAQRAFITSSLEVKPWFNPGPEVIIPHASRLTSNV